MDTPAIQEKEAFQEKSPNEPVSPNQEIPEPEKEPEVTEATQEEVKEEETPAEYLEGVREEMGRIASAASQQRFSDRVAKDIVLQQEREQIEWKPIAESKQHKKLEEEYHRISPQLLPFFDVLDQKKFIEQTKTNFRELTDRYHIPIVERWNEEEIINMFGKGLNPTSLITSLQSVEWFKENLPFSDEEKCILDLGTGAGWSTVMLFNSLRESGEGRTIQYSIDMSPHAIAATETLLCYSGIPYITISDGNELLFIKNWLHTSEVGKNFNGVILVLDEFGKAMDKFEDNSISGIYSGHGTAYLSKNEYKNFLHKSTRILSKDGIFIADSLNPLYTNKLDPLFTLSQMLFPDRMKKRLDKKGVKYIFSDEKMINKSKYFPDQDVKILKGYNVDTAYLVLRWCNYLLRHFETKRLVETINSLVLSMRLVEAYRPDVFPSFLLENIISEQGLSYQQLSGRPDFPPFFDTQGFRLKK